MKVELFYAPDCPNVDEARENLRAAFASLGLPPVWAEVDITRAGHEHLVGHGSPAVLVEGEDVAGRRQLEATCCRLYPGADGALAVAPRVELISSAMQKARRGRGLAWLAAGASLLALACPAAGALCPACWPAYLAIVAALVTPAGKGTLSWASLIVFGLAVAAVLELARRRRAWSAGLAVTTGALLVLEARWLAALPLGLLGTSILALGALRVTRPPSDSALVSIQVQRRSK